MILVHMNGTESTPFIAHYAEGDYSEHLTQSQACKGQTGKSGLGPVGTAMPGRRLCTLCTLTHDLNEVFHDKVGMVKCRCVVITGEWSECEKSIS